MRNTKSTYKEITTTNIPKALNDFAQINQVSIAFVDFDLLETSTIVERSQEAIDIAHIQEYINQNSNLTQIHRISMYVSKKRRFAISSKVFLEQEGALVYVQISGQSKIPYTDKLQNDLMLYFVKLKARYNLLVGFGEGILKMQVKQFIAHIKEGLFRQDYKILISKFNSYCPSKQGYVKYLYLQKAPTQNPSLIYRYTKKNRSFVEVHLGEKGQKGFDGFGNLKTPKPITPVNTEYLQEGDNVRLKRDGRFVYFISMIDGIIVYQKPTFSISKQLNLYGLELKRCIELEAPLSDESIKINAFDGENDFAIGSGVSLKAHLINIKGNVDGNAKIEGNVVKVTGTVHKQAMIKAHEVFVSNIKGTVFAKKIEAISVEHGRLDAKDIHIKKLLGGVVRGHDIVIDALHNYTTIRCAHQIRLGQIFGHYNEFYFQADAHFEYHQDIEGLQKKIRKFDNFYTKKQIKDMYQRGNFYVKKIKTLQKQQKTLRDRSQKTLPVDILIQKTKSRLDHVRRFIASHQDYLGYKKRLVEYDDILRECQITTKSIWPRDNAVIFVNLSNNHRLCVEPYGQLPKITLDTKISKKENIFDDL